MYKTMEEAEAAAAVYAAEFGTAVISFALGGYWVSSCTADKVLKRITK